MLRIFAAAFVVFLAVAVFFDVEKNMADGPDERIANAGEFVGACQSVKAQCLKLVDEAMQSETKRGRACPGRRPKIAAMTRGIVVWLGAHPELHPLPVDAGIVRAADAIWPCRR